MCVSEVNTSETGTTPWSQADSFSPGRGSGSHPYRTPRTIVTDSAAPLHGRHRSAAPDEPYERRWLALGVIAITVLLVILDATIVNIALPAVSADLGISAATQQWIVTAYTLTFGGFLLHGGRIAALLGPQRTHPVGAGGFSGGPAPRRPGPDEG